MAYAELPKKVALKYREWSNYPEFEAGLLFLQRTRARKQVAPNSIADLVSASEYFDGYMNALDDIRDRLTDLPRKDQSIDEPPLAPASED